MSDTRTMLQDQVDAHAASVTAAFEHFESPDFDDVDHETDCPFCDDAGVFETFTEWASSNILEVATTFKGSLGSGAPELDSIEIVFGTGGPHVELEYNGDAARWVGYWAGEKAYRSADTAAEALAEYYWELAEELGS